MESKLPTIAEKTIKERRVKDSSSDFKLSKSWAIVKERYKLDSIIGRGGQGYVAKAKDKISKRKVAIKRVKADFDNECHHYRSKKILREIQILRHLS